MTIADWLTISVIFIGPIFAVQLTRFLDDQKEVRARKLEIFKTLMATRAYGVSWTHVEALNRIDLEFDRANKREKEVIDAWKEYLDLLGNTAISPEQWDVRRVELYVELLHKMAKVLNYDFDKTHIKNSSYSPRAHRETEEQLVTIRKDLIEMLEGKRPLPMEITNWPQSK
jgi:hypothetical protein